MVSILPLICSSTNLFFWYLGSVPRAPPRIEINVNVIVPRLIHLSNKLQVFVCLFTFFYFRKKEKTLMASSFFSLINTRFVLVAGVWWSIYIPKSLRILLFLFSWTDSGLYIYHLLIVQTSILLRLARILMWYTLSQLPHYIKFLKPILFMARDSSSGFRQGFHTFLYGHKKYNRGSGRKSTNEQYGLRSAPSARRVVLWHFLYSFSCIL